MLSELQYIERTLPVIEDLRNEVDSLARAILSWKSSELPPCIFQLSGSQELAKLILVCVYLFDLLSISRALSGQSVGVHLGLRAHARCK